MPQILTGLDRFLDPTFVVPKLPAGARIGLVCHPASVDRMARHAVDRLLADRRFRLVRLFAPEHGVRGEAQDMEPLARSVDLDTRLPVASLYGAAASSLRPQAGDLQDLDLLVCDLQDVGARYYTFVYTIAYVMEAAAEAGIPVLVLDRPNPIGGTVLEGPVLDPSLSSFVGRYPIPVRHGMTPGELARMFRGAFGVRCDLHVVEMAGWRRPMHFEDTGLPWVAPSPNMPTPETARVYPGGCLVEGTNLSEGRGTTRPFELVGAPFIPAAILAEKLSASALPGVLFREASFRPAFQKHAGKSCRGVQVHITDRGSFRPFATYLVLVREARRLATDDFDWRREPYEFETGRLAIDLLLGQKEIRPMLEDSWPLSEMEASWSEGLAAFEEERRAYLLY